MDSILFMMIFQLGFSFTTCHYCEYRYINLSMTWSDAQHYCRAFYQDLATFESVDDIHKLSRPNMGTPLVWIGLYDDPKSWRGTLGSDTNSWRWSATEKINPIGLHKWSVNEPNARYGNEYCAVMYHYQWKDVWCTWDRPFFCFEASSGSDEKKYIFINSKKNWKNAQDYCRKHYTDLAMIETEEENKKVGDLFQDYAWIGLYRVPWRWSDGSNSAFKNWMSGEPTNPNLRETCVTENSDHRWSSEDCGKKMTFLCCKAKRHAVRVKIHIKADLSDPSINEKTLEQLGALLTNQGLTDFKMSWVNVPKKDKGKLMKPAKSIQPCIE